MRPQHGEIPAIALEAMNAKLSRIAANKERRVIAWKLNLLLASHNQKYMQLLIAICAVKKTSVDY